MRASSSTTSSFDACHSSITPGHLGRHELEFGLCLEQPPASAAAQAKLERLLERSADRDQRACARSWQTESSEGVGRARWRWSCGTTSCRCR